MVRYTVDHKYTNFYENIHMHNKVIHTYSIYIMGVSKSHLMKGAIYLKSQLKITLNCQLWLNNLPMYLSREIFIYIVGK